MQGIYTQLRGVRHEVFTEVAKLAYQEIMDYKIIEDIPYKIITGEVPSFRDSVFKERAIVGERLRLALGLNMIPSDQNAPISRGIEECAIPQKYYEPPLVNIIPFACNSCPTKAYFVTNACRGCIAHPCVHVCPTKAVSMIDGRSFIDPEKCVKCGRCKEVCPYNAIITYDRPCAAACGVDAIGSDELGRAKIDYAKCVSCGQCITHCPFGACVDKSQIFQLIQAIKDTSVPVIAEIAPAFVGQFGQIASPEKVKAAIKMLGIQEIYEVAIGADIGATEEAHHYIDNVLSGDQPFLATSCCPSWSIMAKTKFPEIAQYVSNSLTPMVATARVIKQDHPNSKVVFIGPCCSKKLEASRRTVRSDVDFVITFEELMGMFEAKEIDFSELEDIPMNDATANGRGYAVAGGVANAISECTLELDPHAQIQVDRAEGLKNCQKMLTLAKAGKRNGYLLEGMACPGGCVAGAGTLIPIPKADKSVKEFQSKADHKLAIESEYVKRFNESSH